MIMGYESKLIIADKHKYDDNTNYEVIAIYNYCCISNELSIELLKDAKEVENEFYFEGEFIKTDKYGEVIKEIPLKKAIEAIEKAIRIQKEYYRRDNPILSLLKGFDEKAWSELVVLHYGY